MGYKYSEVMEALRAADAAGDVEDARKLAEIALKLRTAEESAKRKEPEWDKDSVPSIPTEKAAEAKPSKGKSPLDNVAEFLSGGKYGSFKDIAFGGQEPSESKLENLGTLIDQSGMAGLGPMGPVGQLRGIVPAVGARIPNIPPAVREMAAQGKNIATAPFSAVKNIASQALEQFGPGISAESIGMPFKIGLQNEPKVVKAFKQGMRTPLPKQNVEDVIMPGDKWSIKTVGELGPGGESTVEATRNYHLQKALRPNATQEDILKAQSFIENPSWKVNRAGLTVPKESKPLDRFLVDPNEAFSLGREFSKFFPEKGRPGRLILGGDLLAAFTNYIDPVLATAIGVAQSPRTIGNILLNTGRATNVTKRAAGALPSMIEQYYPQMLSTAAVAKPKEKAVGGLMMMR